MKLNDKVGSMYNNNKTLLNKVTDHSFGLVVDYPILKISNINNPNAIVFKLKVRQNIKSVNRECIS